MSGSSNGSMGMRESSGVRLRKWQKSFERAESVARVSDGIAEGRAKACSN
jgi:hypothetical protein